MATDTVDTIVVVLEGTIVVKFGNQEVTVTAGQSILVHPNGTYQVGPSDQIMDLIRNTPLAAELATLLPSTNPTGSVPGVSYSPAPGSTGSGGGGGTASGN